MAAQSELYPVASCTPRQLTYGDKLPQDAGKELRARAERAVAKAGVPGLRA